jgi:hypothetical protein
MTVPCSPRGSIPASVCFTPTSMADHHWLSTRRGSPSPCRLLAPRVSRLFHLRKPRLYRAFGRRGSPDTSAQFPSRLHRGVMAKGMPADRRLVSAKLLPRSRPWRGGDRRRLHDPGAADDSAKAIGTRAEARSAYTSGADIDWSGPRLLADAAAGQAQGRSGSPDVLGMRKSIGRQTAQILFKRPRHSLLCSAW